MKKSLLSAIILGSFVLSTGIAMAADQAPAAAPSAPTLTAKTAPIAVAHKGHKHHKHATTKAQ